MDLSPLLNSRLDSLSSWQRERLYRAYHTEGTAADRLWLFPWKVMETPDRWQMELLSQLITQRENALILCSRGAGKTAAVSAAAYLEACLGGFTLVISRSDRQAMKVFEYVGAYHRRLGLATPVRTTMHELRFDNGGKIIALPCREDTIRGEHGVTLLIIDEAARVPDVVYGTCTAMTNISKGRLALLSTPWGQRGFFYKEWVGQGRGGWKRHRYSWRDCPRVTEAQIDADRLSNGDLWVRQEYLDCPPGEEFSALASGPFDPAAFAALIDPTLQTIEV